MAIYATPPKSPALLRRLEELDEVRRYLAQHAGDSAQPWTGALRRLAAAEATVGTTSIEGYGASLEEHAEIRAGRGPSLRMVPSDDPRAAFPRLSPSTRSWARSTA